MAFDPARPWRLAPGVALRPEPFGALAYDYTTRKLSFLKSPELVRVVERLATAPSAACVLAELPAAERDRYAAALTTLAGTGMIVPREDAS